jgi:hypothetical protein
MNSIGPPFAAQRIARGTNGVVMSRERQSFCTLAAWPSKNVFGNF